MIKTYTPGRDISYPYLYILKAQNDIEALVKLKILMNLNNFSCKNKTNYTNSLVVAAIDNSYIDDDKLFQNNNSELNENLLINSNIRIYKYAKAEGKKKKWKVLYSLTRLH